MGLTGRPAWGVPAPPPPSRKPVPTSGATLYKLNTSQTKTGLRPGQAQAGQEGMYQALARPGFF